MSKEWFELTKVPVYASMTKGQTTSQAVATAMDVGKYDAIDLHLVSPSSPSAAGIMIVSITTGPGRDPNDPWIELVTFPSCFSPSYAFNYRGIKNHQRFIRWNMIVNTASSLSCSIFIRGCGYF